MDATRLLERLRGHRFVSDQIVHARVIERRDASFGAVEPGLHPAVVSALAADGIERLYAHQATAVMHARAGRNVVVVTGTASGKTLCYTIPIVESWLADPLATALLIYPTKALTQDQLRGIARFRNPDAGVGFLAGTYDGDTPQNLRRTLRDGGNFVLTNPDMLHSGILPNHARWSRFFSNLKFVVVDEIHAYRGVFGSHLANVLRRLKRIAAQYGAEPRFIASSATIANPKEHAERITGSTMELVTNDGAPRGPKRFVLWNPPRIDRAATGGDAGAGGWRAGGDRRSPIGEAVHLMAALVSEGIQTIAFTRTRLAAELIHRSVREELAGESRRLADSIRAYRGGYLPEERRAIERQLLNREILGVASTNALELGIDIGSLDACIIVGYPGSIASLWQQAGRAGRGLHEAIVFLVAQNSPVDQFLMTHSEYLFGRSPEQAVVDPDNPHIAIDHIRCGAHELPIADGEKRLFGPYADVVVDLLEEDAALKRIDGKWFWAQASYPAADVNLRNIAGAVYTIQDSTAGGRVIGTMDEISAFSQLHTHAVYLHAAETYFVDRLDIHQKIATVTRQDLDYYTQAVHASQIRIDEVESLAPELACGTLVGATIGFGDVTVTASIPMFRKIRFHSRDSLGFEKLELPPQTLETVATWLAPGDEIVARMREAGLVVGEGLIGVANVLVETAQLFVMCDARDVGAVVDAACLGRDALFVHDRYPGGMGYARRCLERMRPILETVHAVVRDCSCEDGCPSCVGSSVPPFAMTDLDSAVRGRIPNRRAALFLLDAMLGS